MVGQSEFVDDNYVGLAGHADSKLPQSGAVFIGGVVWGHLLHRRTRLLHGDRSRARLAEISDPFGVDLGCGAGVDQLAESAAGSGGAPRETKD